MLLVDWQIRDLVLRDRAISPFRPQNLQPASYDLCLGPNAMLEVQIPGQQKFSPLDLSQFTEENPFPLAPGQFLLGELEEWIALPPNVSGELCLRSSSARMGLDHSLAGFIDPGYEGRITVELCNVLKYHPIPIWSGQRLFQVKLHSHATCTSPYKGYYQKNNVVTCSQFDLGQ